MEEQINGAQIEVVMANYARNVVIVRPEVQAFSQVMELVLAENDRKGGWMAESDSYLVERLKGELRELEQALERPRDHAAIMKEAVDVANFAMMVFDRHLRFHQHREVQRALIQNLGRGW